jgi:hypothetical protein
MPEHTPLKAAKADLVAALRRDLIQTAPSDPRFSMLPGMEPVTDGLKAWSDYLDLLRPAGEMAAKTWFPDDTQTRAELYRQLVMNVAQGYIWYFQSTPDHPDWMPFENSIFLLQPNPDGIYHLAPVSGSGVYRVVGTRGTNPIMGFAIGRGMFGTLGPGPSYNNYDVDGLTLADDGSFEVIFSTERPAGWTGDWRFMPEGAGSLLVRQFSVDWGKEAEGRFAIERLDRPAMKPRLTADEIASRLDRMLGYFVAHFTGMTLGYQAKIADTIGFNTMELTGFEDIGNSPEWPQKYWRCIYDLEPGDALVIETDIPLCKYWNVQLNDTLWNQIEFGYRQSSLNAAQARLDTDGKFRAVLSLEDPGIQNWLDPQDCRRGMLVGRWHRAEDYPLPTMKKVPLADVRSHLPADTPTFSAEDREVQLRARNIGVQLRRRW